MIIYKIYSIIVITNYFICLRSCSTSSVRAPEKSEEFKKVKPNFEDRQHTEEMLEKFKVNNSVKSGQKLVKKELF